MSSPNVVERRSGGSRGGIRGRLRAAAAAAEAGVAAEVGDAEKSKGKRRHEEEEEEEEGERVTAPRKRAATDAVKCKLNDPSDAQKDERRRLASADYVEDVDDDAALSADADYAEDADATPGSDGKRGRDDRGETPRAQQAPPRKSREKSTPQKVTARTSDPSAGEGKWTLANKLAALPSLEAS